jgi:hypothetical protein
MPPAPRGTWLEARSMGCRATTRSASARGPSASAEPSSRVRPFGSGEAFSLLRRGRRQSGEAHYSRYWTEIPYLRIRVERLQIPAWPVKAGASGRQDRVQAQCAPPTPAPLTGSDRVSPAVGLAKAVPPTRQGQTASSSRPYPAAQPKAEPSAAAEPQRQGETDRGRDRSQEASIGSDDRAQSASERTTGPP